MIADDSAFVRKYLKEILAGDSEIEIVGTARDGEEAVKLALALRPDVVTIDVEMPKMDGLTALQYIMNENPIPVVVISSLTQKGELLTYEALALGAVDVIAKPSGPVSTDLRKIAEDIRRKVKAAAKSNIKAATRAIKKRGAGPYFEPVPSVTSITFKKLVIIGVSTGGPKTLTEILPELPADLPAPVIVVQHLPAGFTKSFAERLNNICRLEVSEAQDGEIITPGKILVAPGHSHLKIERRLGRNEVRVRLTDEPRDALYKPSVEVAMESALKVLGGQRLVAILLTGMGDDGANAMVKIRNAGGITIAEAEETAVVWGMPREAINRGGASVVVPAYRVAQEIVKAVKEG
ncbi:two-component system, chemotaxis family, response regulator CheB [Caldanaerovirga acetigignens]|uniref:Protein-glutamate methylesterase/protein-glutamine glutaminase n=1 Tax=Caldanaerovirga acetigignens TaxID=447595 RepID=A0A1M7JWA7_9FIRM|nr:two-component system, chemotaxis family, response regulator CheB [Caldanaerovirga acetigignens]